VQAITTADYPLPAPRPAYSMLESSLLAKALNLELPPWQAGVDSVLRALRAD
jgi:dTDP-4-dehydrorhamnose reductase